MSRSPAPFAIRAAAAAAALVSLLGVGAMFVSSVVRDTSGTGLFGAQVLIRVAAIAAALRGSIIPMFLLGFAGLPYTFLLLYSLLFFIPAADIAYLVLALITATYVRMK